METLIYVILLIHQRGVDYEWPHTLLHESVLLPDPSKATKHSRLKYAVLEFTFGLWERMDGAGPRQFEGHN